MKPIKHDCEDPTKCPAVRWALGLWIREATIRQAEESARLVAAAYGVPPVCQELRDRIKELYGVK